MVQALSDARNLVTVRAANALEKIQRVQPAMVTGHGHQILIAALHCKDLRTRARKLWAEIGPAKGN